MAFHSDQNPMRTSEGSRKDRNFLRGSHDSTSEQSPLLDSLAADGGSPHHFLKISLGGGSTVFKLLLLSSGNQIVIYL